MSSSSSSGGEEHRDDNVITAKDVEYMALAARHARLGFGNTYPNPAVGCILVRGEDEIVGEGFHPRAGLPHAEVFALFEACGHVDDGVEAARACVAASSSSSSSSSGKDSESEEEKAEAAKGKMMEKTVLNLLDIYASEGGPAKLFGGVFDDDDEARRDDPVTAYVTLEPCCHYGRTPPCAKSLAEAGVRRVVVGFRDPNPRVDGGGVSMLRDNGVRVDLFRVGGAGGEATAGGGEEQGAAAALAVGEEEAARECAAVVECFAKRIAPPSPDGGPVNYDETMTGAKRRALRAHAGRKKADGTLKIVHWPRDGPSVDATKGGGGDNDAADDLEERVRSLPLDHRWMEEVDRHLWEEELVQLKLTSAVAKKKGAKILGGRIADELGAHVAQVVGHTALCYRPGLPPVLDLDEMIRKDR